MGLNYSMSDLKKEKKIPTERERFVMAEILGPTVWSTAFKKQFKMLSEGKIKDFEVQQFLGSRLTEKFHLSGLIMKRKVLKSDSIELC